MRTGTSRIPHVLIALTMTLSLVSVGRAQSATTQQPSFEQNVLGPGLYVFQTRVDHASCGDAERTGEVTSYYAAVDGIPGSRQMRMSLLNSRFWPDWTLVVTATNAVVGDARQAGVTGPNQGESHFEASYADGRFTGRGNREYTRTVDGQPARCRVSYEALLLRFDR